MHYVFALLAATDNFLFNSSCGGRVLDFYEELFSVHIFATELVWVTRKSVASTSNIKDPIAVNFFAISTSLQKELIAKALRSFVLKIIDEHAIYIHKVYGTVPGRDENQGGDFFLEHKIYFHQQMNVV